jgi:hypothetical protein
VLSIIAKLERVTDPAMIELYTVMEGHRRAWFEKEGKKFVPNTPTDT